MHQLLKLTIAYDGTEFKGWQDNRWDISIEATLRNVIEKIQQHPVQLLAASRTDAGVHADGQIVTFETEKLKKSPQELLLSINALLPLSIRVLDIKKVDPTFHPTLDAKSKEYHYWLCNAPAMIPKLRWTTWHIPGKLDIELMRKAANAFIGHHNFSAFCNILSERNYSDTYRTLINVEVEEHDGSLICIKVRGVNFLYKMVRNIVGTLVYVGKKRISPDNISKLLSNGSRPEAGVTAPANGLSLYCVYYD